MNNSDNKTKEIIKKYLPKQFTKYIRQIILAYTLKQLGPNEFQQFSNEINYMKSIGRRVNIPYSFREKYVINNPVIKESDHFQYILHKGKRLFFPSYFYQHQIEETYQALLTEQDPKSPHCYFDESHNPVNYSFFDIGGAEGLVSLDFCEQTTHTYIFENDKVWDLPLHSTFKNDNNITIVLKQASNENSDISVDLNQYINSEIKQNHRIFIKMDIEGAEYDLLQAISDSICYPDTRLSICTYHNDADAKRIDEFLQNLGFITQFTPNYMFMYDDNVSFRKGVLKAVYKPHINRSNE